MIKLVLFLGPLITFGIIACAQNKAVKLSSKFDQKVDSNWHEQKAEPDRIQLVYDSQLQKKVLRVKVLPGDVAANHNRAELNLVNDSIVGFLDSRVYSWKFKLPLDSFENFTKGKWRIIGQWHDKRPANMSLDDYVNKFGTNRPPPVAIELFQKNNKWLIGIKYGIQKSRKMIATAEVKANEWNSIEVHINWSPSDNEGSIEAKLNDTIITPFNGTNYLVYGRNLFTESACTFKLGIYRAEGFKSADTIYYSDVKIEKTDRGAIFSTN